LWIRELWIDTNKGFDDGNEVLEVTNKDNEDNTDICLRTSKLPAYSLSYILTNISSILRLRYLCIPKV